jgi:hypothetical protein
MSEMKPEMKPAEKAIKPQKHGLSTGTKVLIAGAVGITAFEGGGIAYDAAKYTGEQALPISTMAEHPWCIGLSPLVEGIPSTFDPTALEQRVGPENSVQMTFAEYEKTAPQIWVEQNKTLTIPLPIIFRDNRIPTLHIEKIQNPNANDSLDFMNIDGLEQGDILFSPFDGEFRVSQGAKNLAGFFLHIKGPGGEEISLYFKTTGLNPLVDLSHPPVDGYIHAIVKKGDPIGSLITSDRHKAFNGQIQIDGRNDLSLGSFNLATTPEGKLIEITK